MKTLVIVPAYNEELNIENTIKRLNNLIAKSKYQIDYIIINDGSKDNTMKVCQKNKFPTINLIQNLGIGGAVQTGYMYALKNDYDIAIQFDGDGQHDEAYIETLIQSIEKGNDFVIGSRYIGNVSEFKSTLSRQLGSKVISFFIKLFTRKKIYDPTSGFRAANKEVIKIFAREYPQEYPEPESIVSLLNNKLKISEVPVNMYERKNGKSSIYLHKDIYYMVSVCLAIVIRSIWKDRV